MLNNYPEMICFVAHDSMIDEHYYHCYKVAISFKGTYTCTLNSETMHNVSGHIINRNVRHVCHAPGTSVLIYFIEIDSPLGQAIQTRLANRKYENISELLATSSFVKLLAQGPQALLDNTMISFANSIIQALFPALDRVQSPPGLPDNRLHQMVQFIDTHINQTITLDQMADLVNLSVDRARHLFEEGTGTPFSQYVLWKRIKLVISSVTTEQADLGEAAAQYGFFDQSHFNRVFKRMFGTKPSFFLKRSPYLLMLSPQL